MPEKNNDSLIDELARLKLELDLATVNGGDIVHHALGLEFKKKFAALETEIPDLKERVSNRIIEIQQAQMDTSRVEATGRSRQENAMSDARLDSIEASIQRIEGKVDEMLEAIKAGPSRGSMTIFNWKQLNSQEKGLLLVYLVPSVLMLLLLVLAVFKVLFSDKVDVSVTLDIAQLVGGSLIGLGTLLAGGAYALKAYKEANAD